MVHTRRFGFGLIAVLAIGCLAACMPFASARAAEPPDWGRTSIAYPDVVMAPVLVIQTRGAERIRPDPDAVAFTNGPLGRAAMLNTAAGRYAMTHRAALDRIRRSAPS